ASPQDGVSHAAPLSDRGNGVRGAGIAHSRCVKRLVLPLVQMVVILDGLYTGSSALGQFSVSPSTTPPLPGLKTQRTPSAQTDCIAGERANQQRLPSTNHHNALFRPGESVNVRIARRRVHLVGALVPTPNIAAQAGSIDPTIPAMALSTGTAARGLYQPRS